MPKRDEDVLYDMAQVLIVKLQSEGIEEEKARPASLNAVDEIRKVYGGQSIYFQKVLDEKIRKRNEQIFTEFTGENHDELAMKYGVTVVHIYRIIQQVRTARRRQKGGTDTAN